MINCNKCNKKFDSLEDLNDNERNELLEQGSFVCSSCINEEMEQEKDGFEILKQEAEQLYKELTNDWKDGDNRFRLLNELIETEIEMEKFCNQ